VLESAADLLFFFFFPFGEKFKYFHVFFLMVKPQSFKMCEKEEIEFKSEPMGNLHHMATVVLYDPREPTTEDAVKLAEGRWLYKTLWVGMGINNPPATLYLSIHTHQRMKKIQREYLEFDPLMPKFEERGLGGSFKAALANYGYIFGILVLPGDRIYFDFTSKRQFTGTLRLLNCGFFRS
jgi:hypothetical protein